MPLSYPLSLAAWQDLLPIAAFRMMPSLAMVTSRTQGGEVIPDQVGADLWKIELAFGRLTPSETSNVEALVGAATGRGRSVILTPPQNQYPANDPAGTLLSGHSPTVLAINRTTSVLSIQGVPGGYALKRGDFVSIDFGPSVAQTTLHRLVEDSAAVTGGIAAQVEPNVPIGPVANDAVTLYRPKMKAVIVPDSFSPGNRKGWMTDGMGVELMQTLGDI